MSVYASLLEVQEHDTVADPLPHRRATLPQREELARLAEAGAELDRRRAEVAPRRDEVARRQRAAEDELASVEAKASELDKRLYSGTIGSPRELSALQADVEALRRRCSQLEDAVLEAMDEREPLDAEVAGLEGQRAALDDQAVAHRAALAEAEAAIDGELAGVEEARAALAARLPGDLVTLYEQLRAKLDGVGAARLVGGRCDGCHLTLPAVEVARIKREPPETLLRCDQCGRILVRV